MCHRHEGRPQVFHLLGAHLDLPLGVSLTVIPEDKTLNDLLVSGELDAIAMAVIGGVSLSGGRGSITGTVLGAMIFGVIISGFTFLKLDAYYQEMVKGAIIVGAVVLDQWRQRRTSMRAAK